MFLLTTGQLCGPWSTVAVEVVMMVRVNQRLASHACALPSLKSCEQKESKKKRRDESSYEHSAKDVQVQMID